jgi:hypothetical protein
MAREIPPERLTDSPEVSQALRSLLDHARSDVPEPSTVARFTTRLEAAIAAGVPAPELKLARPTAAAQLAGGKSLGLALGLVLGGLVAGGAWVGLSRHASGLLTPAAAPLKALPSSMERPGAMRVSPTQQSPAASAGTIASATVRDTAAGGLPAPLPHVANREATTEAALLHSARALLTTDPERALRLTQEHARRFSHGALAQEREVIAIESLRRLGKLDAAARRGAAFEQQYPGSVHQSKIEQTLKGKQP